METVERQVNVTDKEAYKVSPSTWMGVFGIIIAILYVLFVVYLTVILSSMGRSEIVLLTIISAINLPILGPVIIWIFLISGQISTRPCTTRPIKP